MTREPKKLWSGGFMEPLPMHHCRLWGFNPVILAGGGRHERDQRLVKRLRVAEDRLCPFNVLTPGV